MITYSVTNPVTLETWQYHGRDAAEERKALVEKDIGEEVSVREVSHD